MFKSLQKVDSRPVWQILGLAGLCILAQCSSSAKGGPSGSGGAGGEAGSGGIVGTGGSVSVGSGGVVGTGGAAATAGSTAKGGASGTGGTVGSGGVFGSGGVVGVGGVVRTGGVVGSGGQAGVVSHAGVVGASGGAAGAGSGGRAVSGGVVASGGAIGTGGVTPGAGGSTPATGGATGGGGAGTCVSTCGSHKWACWPMPNPAGNGPNTASYTTANGMVHDNVTCLDWQQVPSTTTYTVTDAITYCASLTLGGFSDWRVPTRVEMSSIMDWTRSPATDAAFTSASGFHKTGSNWILTVKQIGAGAGKDFAWSFNMGDGIVSNALSAATLSRVRCVHGNGTGEGFSDPAVPPANQYTALSADEVQDNYTKLIWQRDGGASGLITWDAAVQYCATLTLGGNTWRLPTVRELATLVDENQVAPAINRTMFPNTKYGARSNNWYWASHHQRNSTTVSWGLNFDDGFTGFNVGVSGDWNFWDAAYAKCVR
jgi:hypothetical protein